jgi:hypothetical protein
MKIEIRMLANQLKQAITTPSMILFYGVTICGVFFVSSVITNLVSFAPVFLNFSKLFEDTINAEMIYAASAILSASSVLSGYFGLGPAAVLTIDDENLMMSAPIKPHQIFLSRYTRRMVRRISFLTLGVLAIIPLLVSASLLFYSTIFLLIIIIIFLETNYFLGALSSSVRLWISRKTRRRARHLIVVALGILVLLPAYPLLLSRIPALYVAPSNAFALFLIEFTGVLSQGANPLYGAIFLLLGFVICLLLTANITNYEHYEIYSASRGKEADEGKFSRIIHGEVDFSQFRFNDPMLWIMMKDFWSRLRSPMQIWKYVYAFLGTALVVYLNVLHPQWFPSLTIPPALAFAVVPAFILMLILIVQMASVTSMLGFVDERDNVYMLKVSPFRTSDIILSKYLLSLFEVAIAIIPPCGLLIYFIRIQGTFSVVTLAIPLAILFTATGTAVGAYVPVFTTDPKILPVPLAFSFPIINLGLGAIMVYLVAFYSNSVLILMILPLYTLSLVYCFLAASARALDNYK